MANKLTTNLILSDTGTGGSKPTTGSTSTPWWSNVINGQTSIPGVGSTTTSGGKTGGGRTGGGSTTVVEAPVANPYEGQVSTAQTNLNGLVKPTYTNTYQDRLNGLQANMPGNYNSKYQANIDKILQELESRPAFSYNMSDDPLYQQYAAQYQQKGKQAMQDTMGQAAALTGGYGSSYAQTAGNQAYQSYLGQLNDKALELRQLAENTYQNKENSMRSNLSAYQSQDSNAFNQWQGNTNNWYNQYDTLSQAQQNEYAQHQDLLNQYNQDRDLAWQQYQYWQNLYNSNK